MSAVQNLRSGSFRSWSLSGFEEEGRGRRSLFDVTSDRMREKIVLQRLIVIGRLPRGGAERTELGAHYENLMFQLNKQHIWDHVTGLLLVYPSCVLHVVESSREVLLCVLNDLHDLQQQPDCSLLDVKIVFMDHHPQSRLFQQWSHKLLAADQLPKDDDGKQYEEEEEGAETVVCSVLAALQKLGQHLDISRKALPGPALDESPDLIVPLKVLDKLARRDELLTPQQYLHMYNSPRNISMDFGQISSRTFFPSL